MSRARSATRRIAVVLGVVATAVLGACGGADGDDATGPKLTGAAADGQQVAVTKGCAACHSVDGSSGVGPTWKGAWGTTVQLGGGGSTSFDAAYVERAVRTPTAEKRQGATGQMPVFDASRLSDDELASIVDYLRALGGTP